MTRTEKILKNVLSNWAGFAVNALVMLLLTPFVVATLGVEGYGIWVLINSFIGYYGMLDLGFRAGVNQFLIRSIAMRDFDKASIVFSSALLALSLLSAIIILITVAAAVILPGKIDFSGISEGTASLCIVIVGFAAALQVLLSPFLSSLVALQRFDIINAVAISMRILFAGVTLACLKLGFGLIGLAIASAATTVTGSLMQTVISTKKLPEIKISRDLAQMSQLREIGSFGLWNFLISVAAYVYVHLLPILIAAFLPIAAVGHYALAAGLWHQLNSLFTPIGQVLYPVAAEMHVRRESEQLTQLYESGSRLLLGIVITVIGIAAVWAEDFYRLWIGDQFLDGDDFISVGTLFRILLLSTVFGYTGNIAGQILIGAGYIRSVAVAKILGTVIAVAVLTVFIDSIGLLSVVFGALAGTFISEIVCIQYFAFRKLHLSPFRLFMTSIPRLGILTGCSLIAYATIQTYINSDSWHTLIVQGILAGLTGLLLMVFIGMTSDERNRLIRIPMMNITNRE